MGKLANIIYLIGAYKVLKPFADCALYAYNSNYRQEQANKDNT